jgi:hypothetical protein
MVAAPRGTAAATSFEGQFVRTIEVDLAAVQGAGNQCRRRTAASLGKLVAQRPRQLQAARLGSACDISQVDQREKHFRSRVA